MPKGILYVETRPTSPEQEAEYHRWKNLWGNEEKVNIWRPSQSSWGDGDKYVSNWPGTFETMFPVAVVHTYTNKVRAANTVWAGDRMLRLKHSDIGVAVAIDGGLYTPIIRKAETKSLSVISAEIRELAERAKARRLKPQEYQGGSSAISNLGMHGIRALSAIINPFAPNADSVSRQKQN